ncbi:aminoacyl-tRNA hydrolase [Parvicella tangerina]|uniref:Peptidyl-tRNA hydrolase n=1 Tax=Parvicella tangerina TaxID=2829795 RepID=A0A916NFI3_9FLAO|nr:aminoacyl-tRNA hydrolase [Parvicella tangerina]CAG5078613.1 Peptidyl-tRNA hydrolase [Parvicella tangerina]
MKYLIVGLGNPGEKYEMTRHNIGFKTLDVLARASNVVFEPNKLADTCIVKHKGRTLHLIKPTTFMNLSGKAVNYYMHQEKIKVENLLIVTDDIALPFGTLRMKPKGSDGGHNGLKDIQKVLGSSKYPRLRFGIGSDFLKGQQVDYVLGDWTLEEQMKLPERVSVACEMILSFATIGLDRTMNSYNNK